VFAQSVPGTEAKWLENEVRELPWWKDANDAEEIAPPSPNLPVETFDQQQLVKNQPALTLTQIVDAFSATAGVELEELSSRTKRRAIARSRCDLTAVAVGRFGHRVCDLARALDKNPGTVSRWLTNADLRLRTDPDYRSQLDILERRIVKHATENVTL
jgi:hypothetical protein